MDLSKAGEIDYSEFLSAALSKNRGQLGAPSISAAFELLDTDHDGYITTSDLNVLLSENLTKEEVDSMLASPSVGARDGRLGFEDFKFLMLKSNGSVAKRMHKTMATKAKKSWNSEPGGLEKHVALFQPSESGLPFRNSELTPRSDEADLSEDSAASPMPFTCRQQTM